MGHLLIDVLRNTLMITSFVVVIMLFIELLNVFTKGAWMHWLQHRKPFQVLIATLLGLIPGCFGGFAVVSLWTHGTISFGALVAAMLSGVGDEAFVMLVRMPGKALFLFAVLFVLALVVGVAIDALKIKVKRPVDMNHHLAVHEHEALSLKDALKGWRSNFKPVSFTRVLLITGLSLILLAMATGYFEHDHHDEALSATAVIPFDEAWFNNLFIIMGLFVLVTFFIVNDHFLEEHLWRHIIKQHVPKIALWTFGALLLIHFVMHSVDMQAWVRENAFWMLLLAVLIGLIPESGPHLVFITLFLTGGIPFSILLANSITQDGHASLPLLAESKRGFITTKAINLAVGLLVGGAGLLLGF